MGLSGDTRRQFSQTVKLFFHVGSCIMLKVPSTPRLVSTIAIRSSPQCRLAGPLQLAKCSREQDADSHQRQIQEAIGPSDMVRNDLRSRCQRDAEPQQSECQHRLPPEPPDQQQCQADAQPSQNKLAGRDTAGENPLVENAQLRGPEQRLDVQPVGCQYER